MKEIPELFAERRPLFSFEFFLPKAPEDLGKLVAEVKALKALSPDYISLTYGAGGSARARTIDAAGLLQAESGITTACHLTGIAHTRGEIEGILARLSKLGIRHLVALRGDAPKDQPVLPPGQRDFGYAEDLVRFVKEKGGFRMAVAAYPETHSEAISPEDDVKRFAAKAAAGGEWGLTQLFFDNKSYFTFVNKARAAGSTVPIVPGIMPVTSFAQLARFKTMFAARIPAELEDRVTAVQNDPEAVIEVGIDWASRQCRELLDGGAPGIHFYTLNRSRSTSEILKRLRR